MSELLRFETGDGHVVVEIAPDELGVHRAAGAGGIVEVKRRFEEALGSVRDAAAAALDVFRDGRVRPDDVEIEFGVRLNAEVGAVIAKSVVEGHLVVKLKWASPRPDPTSSSNRARERFRSPRRK